MERNVCASRIKGESRININSKIKSVGRTKGEGVGGARSCRGAQGFSLIEQLLSLLIVALTAVLLIRMSAANAIVSQQSARRMSAVRLGSELSAWVQRGGHLALGTPIDKALDQLLTDSVNADASAMCCPPEGCDARSSAWQYLALWQSRLMRSIPDARLMICVGETDALSAPNWLCGSQGSVLLMKLGWPVTEAIPSIVMPLGSTR
jgi:Tfp pilus assembly protein PilV